MDNLYAERDIEGDELRPHYMRHLDRMTRENLHSKSAIAAELAHRDARIAELERRLIAINDTIYAAGAPLGSERYFAIREEAAKTSREISQREKREH
jgi:hypothetical protein